MITLVLGDEKTVDNTIMLKNITIIVDLKDFPFINLNPTESLL
ncbi:MAG: hypothetical protein QXF61_07625 [Nitrososphaeria archaeon]